MWFGEARDGSREQQAVGPLFLAEQGGGSTRRGAQGNSTVAPLTPASPGQDPEGAKGQPEGSQASYHPLGRGWGVEVTLIRASGTIASGNPFLHVKILKYLLYDHTV